MDISYSIRPVLLEDLDTFFTLFSSLLQSQFPEYSPKAVQYMSSHPRAWNKENFRSVLERNSKIILGAFVDKKIVGILDADKPFGGVSLGVWLMVESAFQKKGIGTALLKEWERTVIETGGHNLYLYADKRNKAFYERAGFTCIGMHEKSWFGNDEYIFSKIIQEPKEENYLR